jgi:hypothetical protein
MVHREDTQVTDTRERVRDIPQLSTLSIADRARSSRHTRSVILPKFQTSIIGCLA